MNKYNTKYQFINVKSFFRDQLQKELKLKTLLAQK